MKSELKMFEDVCVCPIIYSRLLLRDSFHRGHQNKHAGDVNNRTVEVSSCWQQSLWNLTCCCLFRSGVPGCSWSTHGSGRQAGQTSPVDQCLPGCSGRTLSVLWSCVTCCHLLSPAECVLTCSSTRSWDWSSLERSPSSTKPRPEMTETARC